MFLEKWGRLFFSQMRPAFFFALLVTPLLGAIFFLLQKSTELKELEARFNTAARKERLSLERKERKDRFLCRYSKGDPYFLDRKIESYPLLQNERQKLLSLSKHPAFPESTNIINRLAFLEQNHLLFTEEKMQTSSVMKEVEEKQRHPVQMDEADLKQILSLLEDFPIEGHEQISETRPQILIKDFQLKNKTTELETHVFEVQMHLIKREFASK